MIAGLDMALGDLAAKISEQPLARFLGGERRPLPVALPLRVRDLANKRKQSTLSGAGHAMIKVVDLADCEAAIDAALKVTAVVGQGRPIWLELPEPLHAPDTIKLISALAERIKANDLPGHVVIQLNQPHENSTLAELQATADDAVPPAPEVPGIVLMADVASDHMARAIGDLGVRGVNLNLQRLGGTLAVLGAAEILKDLSSNMRVGLSTVPQPFGIGARALAEVATALPRLDYLALAPDIVNRAVDVDPPLEYDAECRVLPGEGAGLGTRVGLNRAVHLLSRFTETPARTREPVYNGRPANRFDTRSLLHLEGASGELKLYSPLLERSALSLGLDTVRVSSRLFVAKHRELSRPIGFLPTMTAWSGRSSYQVTVDKELTREMLRNAGVPVPDGRAFEPGQVDDAVQYAASLGVPVVVKPRNGIHGTGVSTDLRTESHVRNAIVALGSTRYGRQHFVVEEHISGDDYRFLVVGDRVVSVVLKRPASVLGDGKSTVVDLVMEKNQHRLKNPHARGSLIRFGRDAAYWLERQGLSHDSIPEKGRVVRLGSAGNVAAGGDSMEILDETHESLLELAVRASHAVPGVDHAGIDLVGDHRRSAEEHRAVVLEVNANPATTLNHFPLFGTPRDVSLEIVRRSCELAGFEPPSPRDELALRIEVNGHVQGIGYRQWFARIAQDQGVAGSIRNCPSGTVEAHVAGLTDGVWLLASSAIQGPRRATVNRVQSTHVDVDDVTPVDRFEVLR